jgi:formylglycine-generating enzyme required for sulfatase activity
MPHTTTPHIIPIALPTPHRLLHVPGGTFTMGNDDTYGDAAFDGRPAHEVTLSDFFIGEMAVTQDLWQAIMGDNHSYNKGERHPVEQVSWFDAAVFCNRLSIETGKKPCYYTPDDKVYGQDTKGQWQLPNDGDVQCDTDASGYRLPTEAEWEYAAKGGPDHKYSGVYAGSDMLEQVGWHDGNSDGHTHEVGLLLPNTLGLYDMSGNIWEWCNDWFGAYKRGAQKNPTGAKTGRDRVLRGGGYFHTSPYCLAAYRDRYWPVTRDNFFGFRLVLQSVG